MSKLYDLINELCPNGVEYKKIIDVLMQPITDGPHETPKLVSEGIPFVSVEAIHDGIIDISKCRGYISIHDSTVYRKKYKPAIGDVYMTKSATIGRVALVVNNVNFDIWSPIAAMRPNQEIITPRFLFYLLQTEQIQSNCKKRASKGSQPNLGMRNLEVLDIPVPPLPVQEEIVRILDNFTKLKAELTAELTARKKQYEYYRDELLKNNDGKIYKLKEIGKVCMCKRIMKDQTSSSGDVPFYKIGTFGKTADAFISRELFDKYTSNYSYPQKGDILISCSGTIGRTVVFDGKPAYFQDSNIVWIDNDEKIVTNKYLNFLYQLNPFIVSTGGTINRLYNSGIEEAEVMIPLLSEQQRIVSILDRFDTLCNDIKRGLPAEIEYRTKQYEYYRDKLLTFKRIN